MALYSLIKLVHCVNAIVILPHYQHAGMAKFTKLEIQDGDGRHLEFRKNVNNSGLDTYIYTEFYGKMHHGHAEITR